MEDMKFNKSIEIRDFIEGISFLNISPTDRGLKLQTPSISDLRETCLPANDFIYKQRLEKLCEIPRMSTFAIID
jgi:hypothetical protein